MSRPRAHFTPQAGWVNDPYGVRWDGTRYHLYFQAVPHAVEWAPECSWGHAVSADLMRWQEQPLALRPQAGEVGCWSGCVVADDAGRALAFYTSVRADDLERGAVAVVDLDDTGAESDGARTVVVGGPPADLSVTAFRDPFILQAEDGWAMLVGGGLADGAGAVFTYRSDNLRTWRYAGLLHAGRVTDGHARREVWECPQLIPVAGRDVLVISVQIDGEAGPVLAAVRSPGEPFGPWRRLVHGDIGYASSVFRDRDERPCLLSWLREQWPAGSARSWAGAESLIGVLHPAEPGTVALSAHPAATESRLFAEVGLPGSPCVLSADDGTPWLATAPADAAVDLRIRSGGVDALRVATAPDRSALAVDVAGRVERLPAVDPTRGLRLFLDADLVEVFWAGSYGAWRLPA